MTPTTELSRLAERTEPTESSPDDSDVGVCFRLLRPHLLVHRVLALHLLRRCQSVWRSVRRSRDASSAETDSIAQKRWRWRSGDSFRRLQPSRAFLTAEAHAEKAATGANSAEHSLVMCVCARIGPPSSGRPQRSRRDSRRKYSLSGPSSAPDAANAFVIALDVAADDDAER